MAGENRPSIACSTASARQMRGGVPNEAEQAQHGRGRPAAAALSPEAQLVVTICTIPWHAAVAGRPSRGQQLPPEASKESKAMNPKPLEMPVSGSRMTCGRD